MAWSFLKFSRAFLILFLLCFPFQIRTLLYGGPLYVTGNFNPYTTFFFYLTDFFLLAAFVLWGSAFLKKETERPFDLGYKPFTVALLLFLLTLLAGTFFAQDRILSLFLSFRFLLFFLLYVVLVNEVLTRGEIMKFFLYGMVFQAAVGFLQYFTQKSAGFFFLGESRIAPDIPGVAKMDWNGSKLLRAYGTFPHPNAFGGALVTALIASFAVYKKKLWVLLALLAIFASALILTFSRSAFFAVVAAFLFYVSINEGKVSLRYALLAFSLLFFFIVLFNLEGIFFQRFLFHDADAALERFHYMDISKRMFFDHPFGVGPGSFTIFMQDYTASKLEPWLFQPVHNVFLLITNELGFLGGLVFVFLPGYLFYSLIRAVAQLKSSSEERQFGYILLAMLAGIVTISLFDHYFFTLYQGQALLFLYFALASAFLKKSLLPRKKS